MFEEKNSANNLPASVSLSYHQNTPPVWSSFPATPNTFHGFFMAKGGGSANKTALYAESKALLSPKKLTEFLCRKIDALGTSACPPYHLGISVGGIVPEDTLAFAKLAASRQLRSLPVSPQGPLALRDPDMEAALMRYASASGIGAQFGGRHLCLDVGVVRLPRHAASCFVGVAVGCSADRQLEIYIDGDKGDAWIEELEENPAQYLPDPSVTRRRELSPSLELDMTSVSQRQLASRLNELSVGSLVKLSGRLLVARDAAHARLAAQLEAGEPTPTWLDKYPIFYAGPAKAPDPSRVGSFGPTTSARMDPYLPILMKAGASLVSVGKGNRTPLATETCQAFGGIYLAAVGGTGALTAECVKEEEVIGFPELGMESVRLIRVENLPCVVALTADGQDLYDRSESTKCCENQF